MKYIYSSTLAEQESKSGDYVFVYVPVGHNVKADPLAYKTSK